ncbi:MAG: hypothetical protein ACFFC7_19935 [Candidatus Hermodarchaeota archaeon]
MFLGINRIFAGIMCLIFMISFVTTFPSSLACSQVQYQKSGSIKQLDEPIPRHLKSGGGLAIEFIPSSLIPSSSTHSVPAFKIIFGVILPMVLIQTIHLKKRHREE